MFSMCSELTPRARILDTRIPQLMQPWRRRFLYLGLVIYPTSQFSHPTHLTLLCSDLESLSL